MPIPAFVSSLLLLLLLDSIRCSEPPQLIRGFQTEFRVELGGKLQITCPVKFYPTDHVTMFVWAKDGVSMSSAANTGLEVIYTNEQKILVIERATLRHSGLYQCEGINGYGMALAKFTVDVYDPTVNTAKCTKINQLKGLSNGAPCFPNGDNDVDSTLHVNVGATVVLNCSAIGNPPPVFKWLKAGKSLDWMSNVQGSKSAQLFLHNTQKVHEGSYTCDATNEHGTTRAQFSLVVSETYEPARILGPRPINLTLVVGKSADFLCRVRAKGKAIIRWGKRIENNMKDYYERNNRKTLMYLNEQYVVIDPKQKETTHMLDTYSVQLKIPAVTLASAGKYMCMVIGPKGEFDQKAVYLYVNSDESKEVKSTAEAESNNHLIVYISVPLVVCVACFCAMIFCVVSRKCSQRNNMAAQRFALKTHQIMAPHQSSASHLESYSVPASVIASQTSNSAGQNNYYRQKVPQQRQTHSSADDGHYYVHYDDASFRNDTLPRDANSRGNSDKSSLPPPLPPLNGRGASLHQNGYLAETTYYPT